MWIQHLWKHVSFHWITKLRLFYSFLFELLNLFRHPLLYHFCPLQFFTKLCLRDSISSECAKLSPEEFTHKIDVEVQVGSIAIRKVLLDHFFCDQICIVDLPIGYLRDALSRPILHLSLLVVLICLHSPMKLILLMLNEFADCGLTDKLGKCCLHRRVVFLLIHFVSDDLPINE